MFICKHRKNNDWQSLEDCNEQFATEEEYLEHMKGHMFKLD